MPLTNRLIAYMTIPPDHHQDTTDEAAVLFNFRIATNPGSQVRVRFVQAEWATFLIELRDDASSTAAERPMMLIAIMAAAVPVIICVMLFTVPTSQ